MIDHNRYPGVWHPKNNLYGRTAQIGICSSHNLTIHVVLVILQGFELVFAIGCNQGFVGPRETELPRPSIVLGRFDVVIFDVITTNPDQQFSSFHSNIYQT